MSKLCLRYSLLGAERPRRAWRRRAASLALCAALASPAVAQQATAQPSADAATEDAEKPKKKGSPVTARYDKGLYIETADDRFSARIRWRVQMRATDLSSDDLALEDDGVDVEAGFQIRRARFKLDGHVYEKWLNYYLEYGIAASVLLTWQFDVNRYEQASLRAGQFKVPYNRERVDSSGKLQFVDRSVVNSPFTIDRQQGVSLSGRLFKDTAGDSRYAVGVYSGTGRGGALDGDKEPMYVSRWQWNFLGRDVPFTESDIGKTPKAIASVAVAGATNRGTFTAWSSSGGGQLPGFAPGQPEQYHTKQGLGEFALMRRGLSLQGEYHFKRIDDALSGITTELDGYYAQVGYFFNEILDAIPPKLELAVRHARVDPKRGVMTTKDRETTIVANYFFSGHDNKLTADVSKLESTLPGGSEDEGWRLRLQWDVSF